MEKVGCVEAVTKILSHVHPEFKKIVDDKIVNQVKTATHPLIGVYLDKVLNPPKTKKTR